MKDDMVYCCISSNLHWRKKKKAKNKKKNSKKKPTGNNLLELGPFLLFLWPLADSNPSLPKMDSFQYYRSECNNTTKQIQTKSSGVLPFNCKGLATEVMVIALHIAIRCGHMGAFHHISMHTGSQD